MKHLIGAIAFGLLICSVVRAQRDSLRFVSAVWRHGDRNPSDGTFPTDTMNGDSTWPQGFAELTELGMREQQHLGDYIRRRYVEEDGFLSTNYSTREVYVRSSSYNRTIMSALSNLAGMYPTGNGVDYLKNIPIWQPIPVHSQPRETDPMLWMECPCPEYDNIYKNEILQSAEVKQIEEENRDFLNFLSNHTGIHPVTLDDVWSIWDPLNCEKIHNDTHQWPEWMNEEVFENITTLSNLGLTFEFHDPRLQRLRGSLLFNDIATWLNRKANVSTDGYLPDLKYYIYSAHDMTLVALMENLGAFDGVLPEYASALLFELHEWTPGNFTVETYYVKETWSTEPPLRIHIKGCDDQPSGVCDLATFVTLAASKAPTDWNAACQIPPTNGTTTIVSSTPVPCQDDNAAKIAAIVLGITTGIFLLAFLITTALYCTTKKRVKIAQSAY